MEFQYLILVYYPLHYLLLTMLYTLSTAHVEYILPTMYYTPCTNHYELLTM